VLIKLNEVAAAENLELEEGADKAIVSLSGGDMRKVLNILESCSLAYKKIPVDKIFEVTGRPSPNDIKIIYDCLTN
jgi:replication factor C subunit 3/5